MNKILMVTTAVILSLFAYWYAFKGGFLWDDYFLITGNPAINNFAGLMKSFKSPLLQGTAYYRPLQSASYFIDYQLWKLNPFGFHLTNFILHLLVGLLVYFVTLHFTKNSFYSYIISLIFLLHPIHTEAVSYISGRADLLAAFFLMSSFLCFIKRNYPFCVLLFIPALFSKEIAVIYPFLLLSYMTIFNRDGIKNNGYVATAVISFTVLAYILLRNFLAIDTISLYQRHSLLAQLSLIERVSAFIKSLSIYGSILVLPVNLHIQRMFTIPKAFFSIDVITPLFLTIIFVIVIVKYFKAHADLVKFSIAWFFLFFITQSPLIFPKTIAEHFMYLPSIGFISIAALLFWRLTKAVNSKVVSKTAVVALIGFYSLIGFSQNINYRDPVTFYRWILKYSPQSFKIHNMLAMYYSEIGRDELAEKHFKIALLNFYTEKELKAGSSLQAEKSSYLIHYNLGVLCEKKLFHDLAKYHFEKAIELKPDFVDAYNNLGSLYIKGGRYDKAKDIFKKITELDPAFYKAFYNLALTYIIGNELAQAKKCLNKALEIKPDYFLAKQVLERLENND